MNFWAGVHDNLDPEAKAAFSLQPRLQPSDGRLTLNCQKDKAAPLPDCAAHVGVATQNSVFTVETPLYEKLIAQLPKL